MPERRCEGGGKIKDLLEGHRNARECSGRLEEMSEEEPVWRRKDSFILPEDVQLGMRRSRRGKNNRKMLKAKRSSKSGRRMGKK